MKFLVLFCHRVRQAHLYSFYSRLHLRRDAQAGLLKNHLQLFRLSKLKAAGLLYSMRLNQGLTSLKAMALWNVTTTATPIYAYVITITKPNYNSSSYRTVSHQPCGAN